MTLTEKKTILVKVGGRRRQQQLTQWTHQLCWL